MITLQFGQCGNQIGHALFSTISSDIDSANPGIDREANQRYTEEAFHRWFGSTTTGQGKNVLQRAARAILIDTEHKAIRKVCTDANKSWSYQQDKVITCRRSSDSAANNYALGNYAQLDQTILNVVARELDNIDRTEGFLFLSSAAGSTGSGIGSHALELLRDEYSTKPFIAATVLPYTFGEVSTQHYNVIFALSRFTDAADAVFLLENERIHSTCANSCLGKGQEEEIVLQQVNRAISVKLAGLLQPINEPSSSRNLNSLLAAITPHPSYKFPAIIETPTLEYDLLRSRSKHAPQSTMVNVLITRGAKCQDNDQREVIQDSQDYECSAEWSLSSDRVTLFYQRRRFNDRDRYRTLLTNDSQAQNTVRTILRKARKSHAHGAFLHRYRELGLEDDDFLRSFAKVESIVQRYGEL